MTDKTTEQVQAKSIVVANIGGYNYIQSDLNNLMFAFTLHSIHKNTGIDFHTFASFEAGIQGAILSAVANMENNKVGIVQYREEVEAATMSSTNETYTDAHFNGRAYTKEQSEVIGDIYVNENILKLTGVTLDSFLFMNANQQAMIVDIAKKAAKLSMDASLNNTRDSILMHSALGSQFFTEGKGLLKEETSKKETPFTSVGRMFHEFLKTNPPDELASKDNSKDAIRIMHQEYSVKEYQHLVSRFHALNIYALLGITFEEFARMPFNQQAAIIDVLSPPVPKPDAA